MKNTPARASPKLDPWTDVERARRRLKERPPSSRAVHEARKNLRRARAVLKLGRGSAVEKNCLRADAACRRAALALAPLRDARVFADTLENLLERRGDDLSRSARAFGRNHAVRARLAEASALAGGAAFRRALAALRACPRAPDSFERTVESTREDSLRRTYRRGRRAARGARSSRKKGRFHALRKAAKCLYYELEWLTPRPHGSRAATIEGLGRLTKALGDEHDLALLRRRLPRLRGGGAPGAIRRIARKRLRHLRRRALGIAKELFSKKPNDFVLRAVYR